MSAPFSLPLILTLHITWLSLTRFVTGPLAETCTLLGELVSQHNLSLARYKLHDLMALLEVRHRIAPEQWEPELAALEESGCARLAEVCSVFDAALQPAMAIAETQPPPAPHTLEVVAMPETLSSLGESMVAPVPSAFSLAAGVPVSTHYRPLARSLRSLAHTLGYREAVRVETQGQESRLILEPVRVDVAPLRAAGGDADADMVIGRRLMLLGASMCGVAFGRAEAELRHAQDLSQLLVITSREARTTMGVLPC